MERWREGRPVKHAIAKARQGAAGLAGVLGILAMLIAGLAQMPAGHAAEAVYTVGNYPIDATASNAVEAKKQAIAEGETGAFRYLLKRLVDVTAYKRLPELPAEQVDGLIDGFRVVSEQNSSTEYVAVMDFSFKPDAVRALIQSYGLPFLDRQADTLGLVTAFVAGPDAGGAHATGAKDWRKAWSGLDLTHALTPVALATPGPSATPEVFQRLADGDTTALGIVEAEIDQPRMVIALAEPVAGGKKLKVSLIGRDYAGRIWLERLYPMFYGDLSYTCESAAIVALGILEGRWKASQSNRDTAGLGGPSIGSGGWAVSAEDAGGLLRIRAEFRSLGEWQQMRARIAAVPGISSLQIGTLQEGSADVFLHFPQGMALLQSELAQRGLALFDGGGEWVLRVN